MKDKRPGKSRAGKPAEKLKRLTSLQDALADGEKVDRRIMRAFETLLRQDSDEKDSGSGGRNRKTPPR